MNSTTKKILIWITSIIAIGCIGYFGFVGYVLYTVTSGCGMDDGPFEAQLIENKSFSDSVQVIEIENGKLMVENRKDYLSPVLTLVENGKVVWTLEMDVSKRKGYESCRLWEISDISLTNDTDPIKFTFIGHWTYGAERGSMNIDRGDGDNDFCLSW